MEFPATARFELRETDPGYGVWDRYLIRWTETDAGCTGLTELDAEIIVNALNTRE